MAFPASLPLPRTPDPMEAPLLRWAVAGPGWIAEVHAGLRHQIAHVAGCVEEGRLESHVHPLSATLATLGTMDRVRRRLGIAFAEGRADRPQ